MLKQTLKCVSALTFIASGISALLVFVSIMAMEDSYPYSKEGLTVIVYCLITWFLFVTALKMWKTEELGNKLYIRYAISMILTAFLLSSAYTGWVQSTNTLEEAPLEQGILPYKADWLGEEAQEREIRCAEICSEVPESTFYHVYVSGREDGNVCECYSSDGDLLRMVPMD